MIPLDVFDTFFEYPDCTNDVDEAECPTISFLAVALITLGIVLVGAVLFMVLNFSGIMDIHGNSKEVNRTEINISEEDEIIDQITQGILSTAFAKARRLELTNTLRLFTNYFNSHFRLIEGFLQAGIFPMSPRTLFAGNSQSHRKS